MSHCPTCCCEHAGKFPKFSFYYADGSVHRGGGPEDLDQIVYSLPRSWVEMPALGVMVGLSEDRDVGRRRHAGMEQVYALAPQCRGGADIAPTSPQSRLIPIVCGQYGIVKLGEHATHHRYSETMRRANEDTHVIQQSVAMGPYEVRQGGD